MMCVSRLWQVNACHSLCVVFSRNKGVSDAGFDAKAKEEIHIGNNVTITILRIKGQSVRIGISAPRDVRVYSWRAAGRCPETRPAAPEHPRRRRNPVRQQRQTHRAACQIASPVPPPVSRRRTTVGAAAHTLCGRWLVSNARRSRPTSAVSEITAWRIDPRCRAKIGWPPPLGPTWQHGLSRTGHSQSVEVRAGD